MKVQSIFLFCVALALQRGNLLFALAHTEYNAFVGRDLVNDEINSIYSRGFVEPDDLAGFTTRELAHELEGRLERRSYQDNEEQYLRKRGNSTPPLPHNAVPCVVPACPDYMNKNFKNYIKLARHYNDIHPGVGPENGGKWTANAALLFNSEMLDNDELLNKMKGITEVPQENRKQ